jgi:RHS repeat-associated protein
VADSEEYLDQDETGALWMVAKDDQGQETRRAVTASEALAYLNDVIHERGTTQIRKALSDKETIPESLLRDWLVALAQLVQDKETGKTDQLYPAIRAALRDPDAIKLFASDPRIAGVAREIWHNLDEIINAPEGDGGIGGPDGQQFGTSDRNIAGPGKNAAPLPAGEATDPNASAGAPPTSAPPLVSAQVGDPARTADPVLGFSGQFLVEVTDFELPGVGLDVKFERTYLHQIDYRGPLGRRWDHTYNLWLREVVELTTDLRYEHVVYRSTGKLAAERFVAERFDTNPGAPEGIADAEFGSPNGGHDRLFKIGGRFELVTPDGLRVIYNDDLRAEALRDANGNEIRLIYSGSPPRLERLVDTCGRVIDFEHDDEGRLVRLRDRSIGRDIFYQYDFGGRLERVYRSVETGQPPQLSCGYRYWGDQAPPGLSDNLLALIDGRGREVLQVEYGEEPGLITYNRVVRQRDGGITRMDYTFIFEPHPDFLDEPLDSAVLRTEILGPTGALQTLDYNRLGRVVRCALEEDAPAGPRVIETRWRYNADGRVISERRPDGSETLYEYGREIFARTADPETATPADRRAFGTLRRVIERRRPGAGGPPLRITELDYDPRFQLITEQRGPYYANELQNRIDQGPAWTTRLSYDTRGNLTEVRYPDCERADGTIQTGLAMTLDVDGRGRLVRRAIALEDGTTLATAYTYPPDTDPSTAVPATETVDADGIARVRTIRADAAGRTVHLDEPSGMVVDHVFDHLGRLRRTEESTGAGAPDVTTVEWAPHDRPRRRQRNRVSAAGVEEPSAAMSEDFEFDAEGNVWRSTVRSADGTVTRTAALFRGPDHLIRRAVEDDVETRFTYNARGLLVAREVVAPGIAPMRWRMEYDVAGRLVAAIDPAGLTERIEYDGFGRVREVTTPLGTRTVEEWDAADRRTRRETTGAHPDAAGPVRLSADRMTYDACGRVIREEQALFDPGAPPGAARWARREYTYDRADRILRIDGTDGTPQTFQYDGLGRIVRADAPSGSTVTTFDDVARTATHHVRLKGTDSTGADVSMTLTSEQRLDARGRPIEEIDGLGNRVRREYNSHGQATAFVDAADVRHEMSYTPDGLVDSVARAVGTPTAFRWTNQFDAYRRLASVTTPRGEVLGVTRDAIGRVSRLTAAGRWIGLDYDPSGRAWQSTESSGVVTRLEFATDGQIARRVVDASGAAAASTRAGLGQTAVAFDYDGVGRLVRADDGTTPVERRYDSRGLLLRETTGADAVAWSYDDAGRAVGFTFPSGRHLTFERAPTGGLERIVERTGGAMAGAGTEVLRSWPWGLASLREQRWRSATMRTERRDVGGRLQQIDERRTAGGAVVFDLQQISDERGLPASRDVTIGPYSESVVFNVDEQARLNRQSFGPGTTDTDAITLAPDGTRISQARRTPGAPVVNTAFNSTASGRVSVQGVARTDDPDSLPSAIAGRTIRYDAFRQISRVGSAAAPNVAVTRDAVGRPRRIVTPTVDVEVTYDGAMPIEIRDANGRVDFVRLPGSGRLVEYNDGTPIRVIGDHDATTWGLVDTNGAVVARSVRDAFGRVRDRTGSWPPFVEAFHQMWVLGDTGWLVSPARTYDPVTGTFLEPDPLMTADGPNQYHFGRGNPLAFTDLTGLMATPGGASGRPKGEGLKYAIGKRGATEWWDQAIVRAMNAMLGALTSISHLVSEPVKQVYDLGGGAVDAFGHAFDLWDYEHKWASGIGQMGNVGVGGVFSAMGKGIMQTPGRVLDAAERGDYFGFGAEAMNGYMLGRSAVGMAKSTASFAFNRGVGALGRLGNTGRAWRHGIREWQVQRMENAANRILRDNGYTGRPIEYQYGGVNAAGDMGGTFAGNRIPLIYERAFTPGLRDIFMNPANVGGTEGLTAFSRFRYSLNSSLKGNLLMRTMIHEGWHVRQMSMISDGAFRLGSNSFPYQARPLEWTQPGYTALGAWNFEMVAPSGSFSRSLASLGLFFESTTVPREE